MARVGLCTLPTERKSLPSLPEAMDMRRVRTAPHARSMYCLDSAERARFMSRSVRFWKAFSISDLMRALNRALLTFMEGFTCFISSTASIPMSSPSLSKSVAIITVSHSFASLFSMFPMARAWTSFTGSTHISSSGSTFFHWLYSFP